MAKFVFAFRIPQDSNAIHIRGHIYSYGVFNNQQGRYPFKTRHVYLRSFLRRKHARKFAKR